MSKRTTCEKNLVCLALEEYAASFAMTLDGNEIEIRYVKDLAARLCSSRLNAEPGTSDISDPQTHPPRHR